MSRIIFIVFASALLVHCKMEETHIPEPLIKRLTEMTYGIDSILVRFQYEYDDNNQIINVYFNDTLYVELINRNAEMLTYKLYIPGEEPLISQVFIGDNNKILGIDSFLLRVNYAEELPTEIKMDNSFFFLVDGISLSYENTADNLEFHDSTIEFDFLYYYTEFMPYPPYQSDEMESSTSASWILSDFTSPIPLPGQDLSFLGAWQNYNGYFVTHTLMHILNISGYCTFLPEKLISQKIYPEARPDPMRFEYEFDDDGYVTTMRARYYDNSPWWEIFQFTYSE